MKNREKSREIAEWVAKGGFSESTSLYMAAMEMAEYKDKQVKSCFMLISKLIKDGVLTKDNPEHIMVEQMMELYNNLKI